MVLDGEPFAKRLDLEDDVALVCSDETGRDNFDVALGLTHSLKSRNQIINLHDVTMTGLRSFAFFHKL
jgi:hypothetical protein